MSDLRTTALLSAMIISSIDLRKVIEPEALEIMSEKTIDTLDKYESAVIGAMGIIADLVGIIDLAHSLLTEDQLEILKKTANEKKSPTNAEEDSDNEIAEAYASGAVDGWKIH